MQYFVHVEYGIANSSEAFEHSFGPVESEWISDCKFFERMMRYLSPKDIEGRYIALSCRSEDAEGNITVFYDCLGPIGTPNFEFKFTCMPDEDSLGDEGHECIFAPLEDGSRGWHCPICGTTRRH